MIIMTAPSRLPERTHLLARAIERSIGQRLRGTAEIIVLDDEPECAGWPVTAGLLASAERAGVRLRYIALPAGADGRVNMRLKRNVGLLLCEADVAVFCDDDDWRSPDSVQAQLDALASSGCDLCTLQVDHLCELDPSAQPPCARFFNTPDGGGIFSTRLGNPGTVALRRGVWESNEVLGFPDSPCEDVDFMRLVLSESPLLATFRPVRPTHMLLGRADLRRQSRDHAVSK